MVAGKLYTQLGVTIKRNKIVKSFKAVNRETRLARRLQSPDQTRRMTRRGRQERDQ
jgi:hypothetical protein